MAKAKLVKRKRKRRLRLEGVATLLFTISVVLYFGAKFGLKAYNNELQLKATNVAQEAASLKEEVSRLQNEVTQLQSRDRILSMVEDDDISVNQEQVVVMGEQGEKEE